MRVGRAGVISRTQKKPKAKKKPAAQKKQAPAPVQIQKQPTPQVVEIDTKRLEKELSMLSETLSGVSASYSGDKKCYIIECVVQKSQISRSDIENDVIYQVYMEGKFPSVPPKVLARTPFSNPSLADGRDLLDNLTKTQWNPDTSIIDLVNSLPRFTNECIALIDECDFLDLGNFHLGQELPYNIWDNQLNMAKFYSIETDPKDAKASTERMLVVTQLVILQLEPGDTDDVGVLVSWATLQSLSNIKRSRLEADRLTFEWKQIGNDPGYMQYFKMPEANGCIELISHNLKSLEQLIVSNQDTARSRITEQDVSKNSINRIQIDQVMEYIDKLEKEVGETLQLSVVRELMACYQQAIEYYSALDDQRFEELIMRMQGTLQNEEIASLLASATDEVDQGRNDRLESEDNIRVVESSFTDEPKVVQASPKKEEVSQPVPEDKFSIEEDEEDMEPVDSPQDDIEQTQEPVSEDKFSIEEDEEDEAPVDSQKDEEEQAPEPVSEETFSIEEEEDNPEEIKEEPAEVTEVPAAPEQVEAPAQDPTSVEEQVSDQPSEDKEETEEQPVEQEEEADKEIAPPKEEEPTQAEPSADPEVTPSEEAKQEDEASESNPESESQEPQEVQESSEQQ